MGIEKILVVDDEPLVRRFLKEALVRKNYQVDDAENAKKGYGLIKEKKYDLVISDLKMPDMTGIELLKKIKEETPSTLVIIMTAFGTIENAVEAMKLGAFNYLIKPFSPDAIEALIDKAEEHLVLIRENVYLREELTTANQPNKIIAESPLMKKIIQQLTKVAKSHANVFIHGESGTGKEVIAQAIHMHSPRAPKPYIRVNCAAIPETLLESEFFGHEKGSFTGASNKRMGRFELAHGGTLLLDEVTEIPLMLQPKLLRAVQEQEFERVGGMKSIRVNVRLLATSNRNLKEAISQKIFREDLYYRLNVIPIYLPPLRERKEDILPLADYFLEKFCSEYGKNKKNLSPSAQTKLIEYPWPGNIRQLTNVIERTIVMDDSSTVEDIALLLD